MSRETIRNKCLEEINYLVYRASPNLINCGRYISSLRQCQNMASEEKDKVRYEYMINRLLQKHIYYLQEAIINSPTHTTNEKQISASAATFIKTLAKSPYAVSDNNYSLVDVAGLKKMKIIKKAVMLKDDLVLPCKVKSQDQKYKFNTQIIMSKDNILSYASYDFDNNVSTVNTNHNVLISSVGEGIKNNELLEKAKKGQIVR